ncbi:MAG: homoserine dehydrogenase [Clostridiales bacterium]|nr:homoserine dehydrogenase [Candidatus Cacconaster stercorequi]
MNIGLLGFGVVGGGVYDLAKDRTDLHVTRVLVRREIPEIADIATRDCNDILTDPTIDTVVEVLGGLHPAYEFVSAALANGKNVVTANKALIAAYYTELTALARENGVALRCTAAVGGGIPWLINLERCRRLDNICELGGIMNGTTNFIMDAMHTSPVSFPAILKKAQELGYAEADPSADIDGDDIRRKLTISANVAFDALVSEEDIPMFGIRTVTDGDIASVKKRGFVCKMLATAQKNEDTFTAFIEPTLVDSHELEAAVPANFNLITYTAEKMGRQSYFGQGAGRYPTAGNVVQDCLDIVCGKTAFYTDKAEPTAVDCSVVAHPYYVRTAKPDAWLERITVDHWEEGIITSAVSVGEMLGWAKKQLEIDPSCFVAGIR